MRRQSSGNRMEILEPLVGVGVRVTRSATHTHPGTARDSREEWWNVNRPPTRTFSDFLIGGHVMMEKDALPLSPAAGLFCPSALRDSKLGMLDAANATECTFTQPGERTEPCCPLRLVHTLPLLCD